MVSVVGSCIMMIMQHFVSEAAERFKRWGGGGRGGGGLIVHPYTKPSASPYSNFPKISFA